MSEKVLFVLEGKVKEPTVLDAIWEFVFARYTAHKPPKIVYTYCTHIYELFKELTADPDIDLLGLLKEDDPDGILADSDRDTFSSVYLFFDYDGHVNMPQKDSGEHWDGDDILTEMLNLFDQETERGKLFVSYPMVEAIQHLDKMPTDVSTLVTAKCKGPHCLMRDTCPDRPACPPVKDYKAQVTREIPALANISRITHATWAKIIGHHLFTAAFLHHGTSAIYSTISQKDIFEHQKPYIAQPCPHVVVLSGFPLFILDYLGTEQTLQLLSLAVEQRPT